MRVMKFLTLTVALALACGFTAGLEAKAKPQKVKVHSGKAVKVKPQKIKRAKHA